MKEIRKNQKQRSASMQACLLEATIDSLVQKGYRESSTNDICKRAGVSRGALLHHYPYKAELMSASVEYLFQKRHQEFRDQISSSKKSTDQLDNVLESMWNIYKGPTFQAWLELLVAARTDIKLKDSLREVNKRFINEAENTLKQILAIPDHSIKTISRLVFSLLDGLGQNFLLDGDEKLVKDVMKTFKCLIRSILKNIDQGASL